MKLLEQELVLALRGTEQSPLARLLASLGADVRGIALADLESAIGGASFLIERAGLPKLDEQGWTQTRIAAGNPRLIHVSVTTFGSRGPRAGWQGGELIASAMGGTLLLTGDPDRAPVKEARDACFFHADMAAAAGALAAHYERGASGVGQHVDIAAQEVAFSRNVSSILVWQFDRRKLHRIGGALNYGRATVRCIWPLADGWCFHSLASGRFGAPANQALSDWIDASGMPNPLRGTDWLSYNRSTVDPLLRVQWEAALAAFFRTRTKGDISSEGRRRGINAAIVADVADVLADPHLAARDFWEIRDALRVPRRFVQLTPGDAVPAPPAGADPEAAADREDPERAPVRPGPLRGVKVLDFSWALVGSITTKILGDLGAEVIKVETRTRPCLSRIDVQIQASRADSFDDKPWYAHLNSSKTSLALDMKKPASREVLDPLIDWADVIVENFSPGTMAKLGLDFTRLRARKPGLIMVSGSVFGQTGPLAEQWGVDGTGGALSGRTYLTGWPDRDPVIPGAVPYGDVIVPYVMAAAASAALQHRRATGRGCHIDAAMYEICVQQIHDALMEQQTAPPAARRGNDDADAHTQGVYAAAGSEQWVAISCRTGDDWQRLCDWAGLSSDGDARARDRTLAAWTLHQNSRELVERLQGAGFAAGVVQDIEDLVEHDPQLRFRQALIALPHPLLGAFGHVRTPIDFSRSETRPFRSPKLGEHSREIARRHAGLDDARLDELESEGVFR
jgi:crotonobetainyl-CoA:carnitine CoA-transferase CaiB-like acyl-CoA transferase